MTGAPPARGYARGRARREEILDAAMELFGEVGYHSASLREIAQRVGISHPGLLHHFASKELLLAAVLEMRDERDEARFGMATAQGAGVLKGLLELVEDNARNPRIVELFCVLSAEATSPDHPAHDYFRRRYANVAAQLTRALADVAAEGGLRPGVEPDLAARVVTAVMDGLQVQWLLDRSAVDMAAGLRAVLDSLLATPLR
ncbi:MAG: TetR/AcrR family transcriptional regulator [Kineosporiaceae bacterium]